MNELNENIERDESIENTFRKRMVSIIFGGSGFIGFNLAKKLCTLDNNNEHKIIIIDKVKNPKFDEFRETLQNKNNLQFFQFDMVKDNYSELEFLETFYEEEFGNNINLYLLASTVGPELVKHHHSIEDYLLNFNIYNYLVNLLNPENNKKLKFNRIIFTSSSEVYGEQANMNEDDLVCLDVTKDGYRPQYALQKLTAENLFLNLGKTFNQDIIVTRLFNIVGPDQKEGFVLSNFNQIFKENLDIIKTNLGLIKDNNSTIQNLKPFNVYGDGKQSRVFTDISDTVNTMHLLSTYKESESNSKIKNSRIINSIINIACIKNETSIIKLVYKYLEFYKYIIQNILTQEDLTEEQQKYLKNILEDISTKDSFINFIEPTESNNIGIGALKRIPTVFKLYKVLGYKPVKNLNNIISDSLFG